MMQNNSGIPGTVYLIKSHTSWHTHKKPGQISLPGPLSIDKIS